MNIAGVEIGRDQPTKVVAEISNAHNGDISRALELVRECAAAGADFIKFQCYTPQELVALRGDGMAPDPWGSNGWSLRDLYEKAQTPHAWFPRLVEECDTVGVPWFSSVFGPDSLALLESLECPAYKIAALDVHHPWSAATALVMSSPSSPVIASTRNGRIPWADLTLWCPEGYPQNPARFTYSQMRYVFEKLDGISYHGTNWAHPAMAGVYDAQMIEVHVQLDAEPSELEADVCLTISQLTDLCKAAR